jgi:hypothetical protein
MVKRYNYDKSFAPTGIQLNPSPLPVVVAVSRVVRLVRFDDERAA